jgi:hypothetical protein
VTCRLNAASARFGTDDEEDAVRRVVLIACVVALLVIGGGVFAWRWSDRGPGRASVGDAIDRFRTSSTVPSATGTLQPTPGVYIYKGTGSETLTFMNTRQSQGPTEPATVTALPGRCWSFRMDFNSFHSEEWIRCSVDGRIVERGGGADQKFDFVAFKQSEQSTTTCDPPFTVVDPGASPGTTWPLHCTVHAKRTGTDSVQTGTVTFVGRDSVVVDGASVPAFHARQDVQLSGDQTGTIRVDVWLAAANGLPLREEHALKVVSPAPPPLNHVTYLERGSWRLTSLAPQR